MRILYLDIDTMSPRHMSAYGYSRETTPNIDKMCNDNNTAVFNNMYTSDAPCLPSRTSLITGKFGIRHGVVDHGGKYADLRSELGGRDFEHSLETDGLFGLFKRAGLRTASVSSFSARHSAWHFNCGFNEVYCYGDSATQQAPEVHQIADDWLDRNGQQDDWLLHINLWDPHTPYRTPDDYEPQFLNEPFNYWVDRSIFESHKKLIGPHTATTLDMFENGGLDEFDRDLGQMNTYDDMQTTIDGYDIGIHYADYHIGLIIDKLKKLNIYEDTIIIVSADHGENMGELGKYSEHGTADVATCHIPFIIKVPGVQYNQKRFNGLYYNIDLVPTVAELFDLKPLHPNTIWDGKSMLDSFRNKGDEGHEYLILSQMSHVLQRSVIFDKYLYIQTYHDGYHPYFEEEMLFDLEADYYEQNNIAKDNKQLVDRAKVILFDFTNKQMKNQENGHYVDPLWYIYMHGGPYHANLEAKQFYQNLIELGEDEKAQIVKARYKSEFE